MHPAFSPLLYLCLLCLCFPFSSFHNLYVFNLLFSWFYVAFFMFFVPLFSVSFSTFVYFLRCLNLLFVCLCLSCIRTSVHLPFHLYIVPHFYRIRVSPSPFLSCSLCLFLHFSLASISSILQLVFSFVFFICALPYVTLSLFPPPPKVSISICQTKHAGR